MSPWKGLIPQAAVQHYTLSLTFCNFPVIIWSGNIRARRPVHLHSGWPGGLQPTLSTLSRSTNFSRGALSSTPCAAVANGPSPWKRQKRDPKSMLWAWNCQCVDEPCRGSRCRFSFRAETVRNRWIKGQRERGCHLLSCVCEKIGCSTWSKKLKILKGTKSYIFLNLCMKKSKNTEQRLTLSQSKD